MTRSDKFLAVCIAFIAGIGIGSYLNVPLWELMALEGVISALFFLCKRKEYSAALLILAFAVLGIFLINIKMEKDAMSIDEAGFDNNQYINIAAEIKKTIKSKSGGQEIIIENVSLSDSGNKISVKILIYTEKYPKYSKGDRIKLAGRINKPKIFEDFDYAMYLRTKGVYYLIYNPQIRIVGKSENIVDRFTENARNNIYELNKKIYTAPQSAIMNALIVGIEADIDEKIIDAFNRTGTRHLLAISGFNISIVALIMMQMFILLGVKRDSAFYFSAIGIILFIAIIEISSSSIRAGIMGELALIAFKIGRLSSSLNAIIFAATLMLMENPYLLRYDIGFQLSFMAVLGLIFIYPRLDSIFDGIKDIAGLKSIFLATVSAQIATLPIILKYFGNYSLMSVISNMLILPLSVAVMIGGFAVLAVAEINLQIARIISWPIWLALKYQIETIIIISKGDATVVNVKSIETVFIILYYSAILIMLFGNRKLRSMHIFNKKIPNNSA